MKKQKKKGFAAFSMPSFNIFKTFSKPKTEQAKTPDLGDFSVVAVVVSQITHHLFSMHRENLVRI
jgi:hypothetical protein